MSDQKKERTPLRFYNKEEFEENDITMNLDITGIQCNFQNPNFELE